jgi:NAD(P)-dependent dehydrogenase (short-subunit alcohol dehydrogenase family)
MKRRCEDQIAVVTGASRGIGFAVAKALSGELGNDRCKAGGENRDRIPQGYV